MAMPMFLPRPGRQRVTSMAARAGPTARKPFGRFEIAA
jgi:hypothetical protein